MLAPRGSPRKNDLMHPRNRLDDRPEDEGSSNGTFQPGAFQMLPLAGPTPPAWIQLYAEAMRAAEQDRTVHGEAQAIHGAIVRLHLEDMGCVEPMPGPQAFMAIPHPQMIPEATAWLYQHAFLYAQQNARDEQRRRSRVRIDRLLGN